MAKYHIFWKFLAKKRCFENKWQSTTFSRTRVSETRVPHQFYHRGTAELEFVRLKNIMWYSSLVNSRTMQHSTQVYQARVPFIYKKKKNYTVLEFTKLKDCVNFFFIFKKRYSSLVYSSTVLHGTRVYQARVPHNFF